MAEKRVLGVSKIEIGDIAVDGGVATTFGTLGTIYKDTAQIEGEDGEDIIHEAEELDDPIEMETTKGRTKITWGITDFDPANLVKILGGTVTGTAPNTKWEEPSTSQKIEKSVKVTSKNGRVFIYPRVSLKSRVSYKLAKSGIAQVLITGTKLQPTKTGTAACIIES
jgi:hypothetical protein